MAGVRVVSGLGAQRLGRDPVANTYQVHHGELGSHSSGSTGLTKRELFAAMAMQALIPLHFDRGKRYDESAAADAVEYADALLLALARVKAGAA